MVTDGEAVIVLYAGYMPAPGRSHALLRRAAALCGYADADLTLGYAPGGKPYFEKLPQLRFSVSHTDGLWACAFAREAVGLDVQKRRACEAEKLAARFFHPAEAAYIRGGGDFFAVWCAKESYVKLTGRGIDAEFGAFSTVGDGERPDVYLHEIDVPEGYAARLCTRGAVRVRQIWMVRGTAV